jgi:hypothetical protein
VVGASWGFKTTILFMLLPTFIVSAWNVKFRTLLVFSSMVIGVMLSAAFYFDRSDGSISVINALVIRATTLQGDLAWYTWDKVNQAASTPPYFKTFLSVLGDRVLEILTGANASKNYLDWASYYFGPAMTIWGGYPVEGVEAGVTNQATLFAESLVVGGRHFFPLVSAAFGILTGLFARWTRTAIQAGRPDSAATWATFLSLTVIPWTFGNGVSSLIYLINLVGGATTYLAIHLFFARRSSSPLLHRD